MKHDSSSADDDKFVELICAYEESITASTEVKAFDESLVSGDRSLAERMNVATRGLDALDRVRRRWIPDANSRSSLSHESPDTARILKTEPLNQRTIGRFRIQHELGRGGVGVVFLGYDPKLRRQVALKVPGEEALSSADMRARFLREAEASARLDHPNVVSVFEVGEAGPLCYIAAEYCSGPTLRQWQRESGSAVEPRLAAEWTAQLMEAVQHAHGRGVLHRDIKPSNVLLTKTQSNLGNESDSQVKSAWRPKLADFGMAKLLESQELHDATRTGTLIGTIPYMAPEQAEGRTAQIDVRSDVYGLGALLYELLTRRPPYLGDSDADTLRQLLFTDIVPPSQVRQGVPRDLEAICLKCLEKDPNRRYATAQELGDDLRRFLLGRPTKARSPGSIERIAMWIRRRPAAAAVSAAMLVAVFVLFGVVAFYSARLGTALKQTEFQRNRAEHEARNSGQLLYSANVRLASDALSKGNRAEAVALLQHHIPDADEPDQREFAWHLLWGQCNPDVPNLLGHQDEVFSVAFSPDGSLLASASKDGTGRLWDLAAGETRFKLEGHTSEVTSVAFHPHGNYVATGSEDRTCRVWHTSSGNLVGVLTGHTDHVLCVAFSHDGKWLATGGRDAIVRIWDVHTLDCVAMLEAADGNVRALDFSAEGDLLAADESGSLRVFDATTWSLKAQYHISGEVYFGATFSDDQSWIAAGGRHQVGRVFNVSDEGLVLTAELDDGHTEWIQGVAFSPRDNTLATAGKDGVIQLWAVGNTKLRPRSLVGHQGRVWGIAWSPDGRHLASAGADHSIKIWEVDSPGSQTSIYPSTSDRVSHVAFSPDGQRLYTGGSQGVIRIWDSQSHSLVSVLARLGVEVSDIAASSDGAHLAAADFAGRTHIWNLTNGSHNELTRSTAGIGHGVRWSPRGDSLAVTRDEHTVAVIDAATGEERFRTSAPESIAWIQYLQNGDRLAISSDKTRIVDLRSGAIEMELKGSRRGCISHGEQTLAISDGGHIVELWDIQPRKPRRRLIAPISTKVGAIAFSADDRTVAIGDRTHGDVMLWDTRTGQILFTGKLATGVSAMAFSPCGQYLLAAIRSDPGQMMQWTLATDKHGTANSKQVSEAILQEAMQPGMSETQSYVVSLVPRSGTSSSANHSFLISHASNPDDASLSNASVLAELDVRFGPLQLFPRTGPGETACAVRDIDNDGDTDVAVANFRLDRILWYANDGLGKFTLARVIGGRFSGAEDVFLSDLDRNGWLDAICPSNGLNEVHWYRDVGDFEKDIEHYTIRDLDRPHALITADLNGDGYEEMIWAERGKDKVSCAFNEAGMPRQRIAEISAEAGSGETLAAGDFDQDGDLDILASSNRRGLLLWIENQGQGQFAGTHVLQRYQGSSRNADVADLDDDGDLDIVVPFLEEDRVVLFENLQDRQFLKSPLPTVPGSGPCSVAAGDLDGDGDIDLVVGGRKDALITVFLNDGTGHFTRSSRTVNAAGENFDDVEVTELNGDGKADIVFAGYRGPGLGWHEGAGVAFAYRSSVRQEKRYAPWNQDGLAIELPTHDRLKNAPLSATLLFTNADGQVLSSSEFGHLVERVVVYRDSNHNGLAEIQWEPKVAELHDPTIKDGVLHVPLPRAPDLPTPPGSQAVGSGKIMGIAEVVHSVSRWATNHNRVAALPICNGNHRANDSPTEVVTLKGPGCKVIDVTLDELHAAGVLPLSDYEAPDSLYAQNTSCIDVWARAHGYRAGVLLGGPNPKPTGAPKYRVVVFLDGSVTRKSMTMTELEYPVGFESLCQKVQEKAETLGFVAGFPVLVSSSETVECIFLGSDTGKIEKVSIAESR